MDSWKEWTDLHKVVAEINEPLATKDSREKLHDTTNATDSFKDWRSFFKELANETYLEESKEDLEVKATNYFADTIVEFLPELGGQKLYECFANAVKQAYSHAQKEYDDIKDLSDCLNKKRK